MNKWLLLITPLQMMIPMIVEAAQGEDKARPAAGVLQPPTLGSSHLVDTIIGLLVVLGLMLALAWLVKRYVSVPGIGKGQVQILGGVSLGPRERAVLVSVEGQRLLLGVAPGRVQTLHVLETDDASDAAGEGFAGQLERAAQEDAS